MSHAIAALVIKGPYDADEARRFDLHSIDLGYDLTLFPLHFDYCDHWAAELNSPGAFAAEPILNMNVVHRIARRVAIDPLFAIIETDYFGGSGDQAAAVYHGDRTIMPPERSSSGPINEALKLLGVPHTHARDQFEATGLHHHRTFDKLFDDLPYVRSS